MYRYSVRECIGSGMAGKVYRARDRQSGETVAIKVLEKVRLKPQSTGALAGTTALYRAHARVRCSLAT